MSTSAAAPAQVNIGEAFGYVFRSRAWLGRIALGALCLLFFWVFLIPVFIMWGYFVETARTVSQGGRELPAWDNIGKKLREGFVFAVVLFVWSLPGWILSGGGSFDCAEGHCTYHPGSLASLGGLYSLLLGLVTAAIWSQFLLGGFGGSFDFRAVFRRTLQQPSMTVLVWLMALVAVVVSAIVGTILILVGLLFTLPYAFAVVAHLYGQFSRLTQQAATAT